MFLEWMLDVNLMSIFHKLILNVKANSELSRGLTCVYVWHTYLKYY